jgi:aminopeptidase
MTDERIQRLARLTVEYSLGVSKGQLVAISAPASAETLVLELVREVLKAGGYTFTRVSFPRTEEIFYTHAQDHQLEYVNPINRYTLETVDAYIVVHTTDNLKILSNVDPARQARAAKAQTEIQKIFMQRLKQGWYALVPFPSPSLAQEAAMGTEEYENFVYRACLVDRKDPVKEWQKISAEQAKIKKYLDTKRTVHFLSKDVDLTATVTGRPWVNCDGHLNMPDGEIFTSPVENSVEGTIRFSYPGIFMGKAVDDVTLTFSKGKVVKATAAKGQDLLDQLLKIDEGAQRLGEIAIGTNPGITRFTKNILFDEKLAGTMHCALGNGFEESGGKNESAIHWDLLADMTHGGQVYADEELFYKDGKFVTKVIG